MGCVPSIVIVFYLWQGRSLPPKSAAPEHIVRPAFSGGFMKILIFSNGFGRFRFNFIADWMIRLYC